MKLSRDNKLILIYGAGVLLAVCFVWMTRKISFEQLNPAIGATTTGMGVVAMCLVGAAGIVLAVLSILVPVFIYNIHENVRKMREIAEKNQARIEQMRLDLSLMRKRWEA